MAAPAGAYRADIDGLRAIAVLSVVAYHAGLPLFTGGFVGVDIFFVISGYLIGGIVERELRAGVFSFTGFYARRARRLLPALAGVLLFGYGGAALLLAPSETLDYAHSALATIFAVSNVLFWKGGGYFSPAAEHDLLLMTWSLGVEEQFYICFPIVLVLLLRLWRPRVFLVLGVLSAASLALSVWAVRHAPTGAFYLLPARAWELGAGILLVLRLPPRVGPMLADGLGLVGLALILGPIFGYTTHTPFPGLTAVPPVLGAVLLIAVPQSRVNRIVLAAPPMVLLGLISYSWYLWHWPLLAFARISTVHELGPALGAAIAVLSAVAGYLSWRFIERPFRRGPAPAAIVVRRAAAVLVLLATPAVVVMMAHGWPQRFDPALSRLESQTQRLVTDPCLGTYGAREPDQSPVCMPPDDGRPAVAVLGDSHAAALAPGLRAAADRDGRRFLQLTASSCPTIAGLSRLIPGRPSHLADCAEFSHRAADLVLADPSIDTVVLAGYWSAPFGLDELGERFVPDGAVPNQVSPADSRENLVATLDRLIGRLEAAGKRVVLVKDVPLFDFDPMDRRITEFVPARRWLFERFAADRDPLTAPSAETLTSLADPLIDRVAAAHPAVRLVDPKLALCAAGRCRFADADDAFYLDNQHLTAVGARFVVTTLGLNFRTAQP